MGWFADVDDEATTRERPFVWQPVLAESGGTVIVSLPTWFASRADCEAFIRDQLIPNASTLDHDCESCEACLHDGQKCCGCYDGVCCQERERFVDRLADLFDVPRSMLTTDLPGPYQLARCEARRRELGPS